MCPNPRSKVSVPAPGGEFTAPVPMMGGEVRHKIDADITRGILDLYFSPQGAPYGPPSPVRLVPNGDGVDVLWTLARFPGVSDQPGSMAWPHRSPDSCPGLYSPISGATCWTPVMATAMNSSRGSPSTSSAA